MTRPLPANPDGAAPAPDIAAIKARQQGVWASGDYARIGTTLQIVGEQLCEALDLHGSERVLDVAAGNGNAALAAARRWCAVTATDYVPALLERARTRAEAEGLPLAIEIADAEQLPYDAASFDVVTSTFGVMFTPDPPRAAAEMLRVCRPGGRIGLANWTPAGFVGRMLRLAGRHVPPPAGLQPPTLWGTRERLGELFGAQASRLVVEERDFNFRYRSPAHFVDVFRDWYGPVHKAFAALPPAGQTAFEQELIALIDEMNLVADGPMLVPGRYLEVVVHRA